MATLHPQTNQNLAIDSTSLSLRETQDRNLGLGDSETEANPGPGDEQEVQRHSKDTPGFRYAARAAGSLPRAPPLKPPRASLGTFC